MIIVVQDNDHVLRSDAISSMWYQIRNDGYFVINADMINKNTILLGKYKNNKTGIAEFERIVRVLADQESILNITQDI